MTLSVLEMNLGLAVPAAKATDAHESIQQNVSQKRPGKNAGYPTVHITAIATGTKIEGSA